MPKEINFVIKSFFTGKKNFYSNKHKVESGLAVNIMIWIMNWRCKPFKVFTDHALVRETLTADDLFKKKRKGN